MDRTQLQGNKRIRGPKIIKKYGNRKLYDTEQSSYVVLKDIEKMIRNKEEIRVIDNETQDDITISTLTQIIFSSEKKSQVSPPINVLKSIIREGDGSFSSFLAKLGLFEVTERRPVSGQKIDKVMADAFSSDGKKTSPVEHQTLEQRISRLVNSDEGLDSSENKGSVPDLPGNRLS